MYVLWLIIMVFPQGFQGKPAGNHLHFLISMWFSQGFHEIPVKQAQISTKQAEIEIFTRNFTNNL